MVYTSPARKASATDAIRPRVSGSLKKRNPAMDVGNLFKAPTIENVVEEVTLTHQLLAYDIPKDNSAENAMANTMPRLGSMVVDKFLQ